MSFEELQEKYSVQTLTPSEYDAALTELTNELPIPSSPDAHPLTEFFGVAKRLEYDSEQAEQALVRALNPNVSPQELLNKKVENLENRLGQIYDALSQIEDLNTFDAEEKAQIADTPFHFETRYVKEDRDLTVTIEKGIRYSEKVKKKKKGKKKKTETVPKTWTEFEPFMTVSFYEEFEKKHVFSRRQLVRKCDIRTQDGYMSSREYFSKNLATFDRLKDTVKLRDACLDLLPHVISQDFQEGINYWQE